MHLASASMRMFCAPFSCCGAEKQIDQLITSERSIDQLVKTFKFDDLVLISIKIIFVEISSA